jgi:hypothetical protein
LASTAVLIAEKRDRLLLERAELREAREALLARSRRVDREIADCRAAARFFNLNLEFPEEPSGSSDREVASWRFRENEARQRSVFSEQHQRLAKENADRLAIEARDRVDHPTSATPPPSTQPAAPSPPPPSSPPTVSSPLPPPHSTRPMTPSPLPPPPSLPPTVSSPLPPPHSQWPTVPSSWPTVPSTLPSLPSSWPTVPSTLPSLPSSWPTVPSTLPSWPTAPSPPPSWPTSESRPRPTVREVALARLRLAGGAGAKASQIREYFERTFGEVVHEKTVGMTLYRLLKLNRVRRDGHTWFYVPPEGETKNPGVGAPGQIDSGN